ncbi:hypothetical protein QR77_23315 [Streptomyces sp. 150FB]|uniref:hypothetical protein n=1 Tax=Streptomyces sp. 150FB TaxID=1576605 RepID=UPI00058968A9|nr:hypothetical protein [Streptomyces sp. 150FB]KIF76022.1 hypothetical protein QR77_23315 [Streptomyces sp. 150FB]
MAGLAAFGVFAAGCSTGGTGARDEGPAVPAPVERGVPSPTTTPSPPGRTVNAVALLRNDPRVSKRIKTILKPCDKDSYPVDTSYGELTGSSSPDVVINVMACGDAVGLGAYVYRETASKYVNVFMAEEPSVYATIDRGELVVTQQVYTKGDTPEYPSGEDVVTYTWTADKFTERYRVRNNYSRAVGKGELPYPEPPALPSEN